MERNKLFWASRRGMLELDLILQPFVDRVYPSLSPEDQARYVRLLTCEDQDLFGWLMQHHIPADGEILRIVAIIRAAHEQQS